MVSADATIGPPPLPTLDPDRQAMLGNLAALIAAVGDDMTRFHTRIEQVAGPGHWLHGAGGPSLRIDAIGGERIAVHPDRVDALVNALDRLEPLLDLIEARTGWVIEPESTGPAPSPDALVIAVDATRGGEPAAHFALAVPPTLAAAIEANGRAAGGRLARVPLPCRLDVAAVQLSVEDAGALGPGDLVLLGSAPWPATLSVEAAGDFTAAFHPDTGALTLRLSDRNTALSDGDPPGLDQLRAFRVPVEIKLPGVFATLEQLAALREGGTFALGALTAGLAVELSVGGRALATGELVRLGDRYAVLIDRAADMSPAAPPTLPVENG
ncbi:FliM/FliN family flagellar motor switch protein [uncultured Sphingomonas sp.]|uniref:FliM/FliN family flagellar motor switch protein n=1 Tax=uncultured Sphingomonas sp. TaxID=158754 RepID=UPI0035CA698A